jgi:translation initiation factor IF-2
VNRIKQALTEYNLVAEEWGGDTIYVAVSAKEKTGIDELLDMILLKSDLMELKANPDKNGEGIVVEAKMEKGRGPVATVLVQEGTLTIGDNIIAGTHSGKIRAMSDDLGNSFEEAKPGVPVEIIGFSSVPVAGDSVISSKDEKVIKQISDHRVQKMREAELAASSKTTLEDLYDQIKEGETKEINLIVKADTNGSVEALSDSFQKLSTKEVKIRVLHGAVGAILETDIMLASASNALVIGFNVRPDVKATAAATREKVDIKTYNIIYEAIDDLEKAIVGALAPQYSEEVLGKVEVRETFVVPIV